MSGEEITFHVRLSPMGECRSGSVNQWNLDDVDTPKSIRGEMVLAMLAWICEAYKLDQKARTTLAAWLVGEFEVEVGDSEP